MHLTINVIVILKEYINGEISTYLYRKYNKYNICLFYSSSNINLRHIKYFWHHHINLNLYKKEIKLKQLII